MINLGTYMKTYRVGDIVDIKANGAVQKGMPYKVYHGKTGVIYNVTRTSVGVIINKKVGNQYMEKRVNVRVEHIAHSRSREECKSLVSSAGSAVKGEKADVPARIQS